MPKPIIIANRGNCLGRMPVMENTAIYLTTALDAGFHIKVDVWSTEKGLFFGAGGPVEKADLGILGDERTWCQANNLWALDAMLDKGYHCFYYDSDAVALTSRGYIWTLPGKTLFRKSICMMPDSDELPANWQYTCAGVCTDRAIELEDTGYFDCTIESC